MRAAGIQRWLLPAAGFLTAAALGWVAGGGGDGSPVPPGAGAPPPRPGRGMPVARHAPRAGMPEDVQRQLAAVRAARTPEERQRAAIQLARTLPVAELAAWFDAGWYPFHDGIDSTLFYRIARGRWLAEDPAGLLDRCLLRNSEATYEMIREWTKRDPAGALAWVEALERPRDTQRVAYGFYQQLALSDPALALGRVEALHAKPGVVVESHVVRLLLAGLAEKAGSALRAQSAGWPPELRRLADGALASATLKRDFATGLAELRGRPDGRELFVQAVESESMSARNVLEFAAELPAGWLAAAVRGNPLALVQHNAAAWLDADLGALGVDESTRRSLRSYAMGLMAHREPAEALGLLDRGDLTADERSQLLGRALEALARKDAAAAREWVARLTDEAEIELATKAVAQGTAAQGAQERKPASPQEWVAGLAAGGEETQRIGYNPGGDQGNWDTAAIAEARAAFATLDDAGKAAAALRLTDGSAYFGLSGEMFELRADATAFLLEHPDATPPAEGMARNVSQLAANWVAEDPAAASRWVAGLPAGEERTWAMKNLARHWAEHEPTAAAAWARSLPAAERAQVEGFLAASPE